MSSLHTCRVEKCDILVIQRVIVDISIISIILKGKHGIEICSLAYQLIIKISPTNPNCIVFFVCMSDALEPNIVRILIVVEMDSVIYVPEKVL